MLCQDKMAIKTCVQYYIVYICISICRYFISVLYQYVYFVIVLYIEGKHATTIGNNVLLNTNYNVVKIHIFLRHLFLSHFITNTNPMHTYIHRSSTHIYIRIHVSVIVSAYVRS